MRFESSNTTQMQTNTKLEPSSPAHQHKIMLSDTIEPMQNLPINQQDRSYHPDFVKKKALRVKVRMLDGHCCIGECHVLWPDGRTSDVINDDRKFLILTDATVEGEHHVYNILTLNKSRIEMIFELHRPAHLNTESEE